MLLRKTVPFLLFLFCYFLQFGSALGEEMLKNEIAVFGGGCFWCLEPVFQKLDGVEATCVGYTGGHTADPTYEEVCSGTTGHVEVIQIEFNPSKISYSALLAAYWVNIDPSRCDGQFCDIGSQYKPVIFYTTVIQKEEAERSKEALIRKGKKVLVEILPAQTFYPAEEYHQNFYKKNPYRYNSYKLHSGREEF